ncbi:hypothetical protein PTSG_05452 [Salpingoeca rosetta]|uniref:Uncharacterized protein n=1 Tax=Salpingoeca rosetta (strain ATCC 50818 / BSB-021) TaxID=946362 RepID=F2UB92_SALR5|nr:uncharacterized protein PTSG_05452 [Salpingoeca rosetta]EGD73758.1 hypothetical protein PTSG_05452 [Salpingoeca rosetta]|eukprot:XP_004993321.1 hypothetical protein PTSG_05452 [Salpingoeca rosetta]
MAHHNLIIDERAESNELETSVPQHALPTAILQPSMMHTDASDEPPALPFHHPMFATLARPASMGEDSLSSPAGQHGWNHFFSQHEPVFQANVEEELAHRMCVALPSAHARSHQPRRTTGVRGHQKRTRSHGPRSVAPASCSRDPGQHERLNGGDHDGAHHHHQVRFPGAVFRANGKGPNSAHFPLLESSPRDPGNSHRQPHTKSRGPPPTAKLTRERKHEQDHTHQGCP